MPAQPPANFSTGWTSLSLKQLHSLHLSNLKDTQLSNRVHTLYFAGLGGMDAGAKATWTYSCRPAELTVFPYAYAYAYAYAYKPYFLKILHSTKDIRQQSPIL